MSHNAKSTWKKIGAVVGVIAALLGSLYGIQIAWQWNQRLVDISRLPEQMAQNTELIQALSATVENIQRQNTNAYASFSKDLGYIRWREDNIIKSMDGSYHEYHGNTWRDDRTPSWLYTNWDKDWYGFTQK